MRSNIQNLVSLIDQIIIHLDRIPNESYSERLLVLGNSTVGEHVRHIYNFPECLLQGIQTGKVSYDKRIRNRRFETDKDYAVNCLLQQSNYILNLDNYADTPLILEVGLTNTSSSHIKTNLTRELHYVIEHTIHHMAILRIGISFHFPDLRLEDSFGFSYSTLEYKNITVKI